MGKKITIKKLNRVSVPDGEYDDIVGFQLVEFTIDFFGSKQTDTLDTKILQDGRQFVIGGNGWMPHNYEITNGY